MPARASVVKHGDRNSISGIKRVHSAVQSSEIEQIRAVVQALIIGSRHDHGDWWAGQGD